VAGSPEWFATPAQVLGYIITQCGVIIDPAFIGVLDVSQENCNFAARLKNKPH
jgi:hypothetical protein